MGKLTAQYPESRDPLVQLERLERNRIRSFIALSEGAKRLGISGALSDEERQWLKIAEKQQRDDRHEDRLARQWREASIRRNGIAALMGGAHSAPACGRLALPPLAVPTEVTPHKTIARPYVPKGPNSIGGAAAKPISWGNSLEDALAEEELGTRIDYLARHPDALKYHLTRLAAEEQSAMLQEFTVPGLSAEAARTFVPAALEALDRYRQYTASALGADAPIRRTAGRPLNAPRRGLVCNLFEAYMTARGDDLDTRGFNKAVDPFLVEAGLPPITDHDMAALRERRRPFVEYAAAEEARENWVFFLVHVQHHLPAQSQAVAILGLLLTQQQTRQPSAIAA